MFTSFVSGSRRPRENSGLLTLCRLFVLIGSFLSAVFAPQPGVGESADNGLQELPAPGARKQWMIDRDELGVAADQLRQEGKLSEAVMTVQHKLAVERLALGNEHADVARTFVQLAELEEARENFDGALAAIVDVAKIRSKLFGQGNWQTVDARLEVARIERARQLVPDDLRKLRQAKKCNEQAFSSNRQGKNGEAAERGLEAVEIYRELLGEDSYEYAVTLFNVAMFYSYEGQHREAEPLFLKSAPVLARHWGRQHPSYANALEGQASNYQALGNQSRALELYREALEVRRAAIGDENREVIDVLSRLSQLEQESGQFAAARDSLAMLVGIEVRVHGPLHWWTRHYRGQLAHAERLISLSDDQRAELKHADVMETKVKAIHEGKEPLPENSPTPGELLQTALEIRRRILGNDDVACMSLLHNLAVMKSEDRDFAGAAGYFQQAMDLILQNYGEKHPRYYLTLALFVASQSAAGNRQEADILYDRAMAVINSRDNEKEVEYGTVFHRLGAMCDNRKRYKDAEKCYLRAMRIRESLLGEGHPDSLETVDALARCYHWQRLYGLAKEHYERAVSIRVRVLGDKHLQTAQARDRLGEVYEAIGDDRLALVTYRAAWDTRLETVGEDNLDYATSLTHIARIYAYQKDHAGAALLYRKAADIRLKILGANHADFATTLRNLGSEYRALKDYQKAEELLNQSLEITKNRFGVHTKQYADGLLSLATLCMSARQYDRCESLFNEALTIHNEIDGDKTLSYARVLNRLGNMEYLRRNYIRAEEYCRQAATIFEANPGSDKYDYSSIISNIGNSCLQRGDYAEAERLYRQALDIRSPKGNGQIEQFYGLERASSLRQLGDVKHFQRDYASAAAFWREALAVFRSHYQHNAISQSERQQFQMSNEMRIYLDRYLSAALEIPLPADEIYAEVLKCKGSVTARQWLIRRMCEGSIEASQPEIAEILAELAKASAELELLVRTGEATGDEERRQDKLTQLCSRIQHFEEHLTEFGDKLTEGRSESRLADVDSRREWPEKLVFVDMLEYDHVRPPTNESGGRGSTQRQLILFVLRRDEPVAIVQLGLAEPVTSAVENWRLACGRKQDEELRNAGLRLREIVWSPLESHLQKAETALICPDGALTRFPFGALPGNRENRYLIEDIAIATVPTPQILPDLLARKRQTRGESASLLIAGNIDFDAMLAVGSLDAEKQPVDAAVNHDEGNAKDAAGTTVIAAIRSSASNLRTVTSSENLRQFKFQRLPGTAEEFEAVKQCFVTAFPSMRIDAFDGAKATKKAFCEGAPHSRYVHLATHGFFSPTSLGSARRRQDEGSSVPSRAGVDTTVMHPGLLCGLAFAGGNRVPSAGQDDGILTALEVQQLDLKGVELAVLSACETGLGKAVGGEGLLGLQRSFQVAGAETVIAGFWQVSDFATTKLMSRFYKNLWSTPVSKLEALRQAQLWMLNELPKDPAAMAEVTRGIDIGKDDRGGPVDSAGRLKPFYWAAFVLSGDWR